MSYNPNTDWPVVRRRVEVWYCVISDGRTVINHPHETKSQATYMRDTTIRAAKRYGRRITVKIERVIESRVDWEATDKRTIA